MEPGGTDSDIRVALTRIEGGVQLISERVDNFNRSATERHDFLSDRVTKIAEKTHENGNTLQIHGVKLDAMEDHDGRITALETDKTLRDGHNSGVWATIRWGQVGIGAAVASGPLLLAALKGWL